jgi:hypothetical protein
MADPAQVTVEPFRIDVPEADLQEIGPFKRPTNLPIEVGAA